MKRIIWIGHLKRQVVLFVPAFDNVRMDGLSQLWILLIKPHSVEINQLLTVFFTQLLNHPFVHVDFLIEKALVYYLWRVVLRIHFFNRLAKVP